MGILDVHQVIIPYVADCVQKVELFSVKAKQSKVFGWCIFGRSNYYLECLLAVSVNMPWDQSS
jgi:hypothetical protein